MNCQEEKIDIGKGLQDAGLNVVSRHVVVHLACYAKKTLVFNVEDNGGRSDKQIVDDSFSFIEGADPEFCAMVEQAWNNTEFDTPLDVSDDRKWCVYNIGIEQGITHFNDDGDPVSIVCVDGLLEEN
jgi:hypothetical protein